MLSDSPHRPAVCAALARTRRRAYRAVVLPLAAHRSLCAGELCIRVRDTVRGIRGFAGAMLPLSAALPVVLAAWIVNQAIGFGVLGYPMDMNTLLWGLAIGVAALAATAASAQMLRLLPAADRVTALALALIAAYAAYEIVLSAFTVVLGDGGAFTLAVVARLGLLNVLWMLGLVAVCEIAALLVAATRHRYT